MKYLFTTIIAIVLLIVDISAMGINGHEALYKNDKYGFSFIYPKFQGGQISEKSYELKSNPLKFVVLVYDDAKPFLSVSVFEKPKEFDLLSFATKYLISSGTIKSEDEVGIIKTIVDNTEAFQLTFWLFPGTGCATSELVTANDKWIYRISSSCNSTYLPNLHRSFKFLNNENR
jgi:hypothetical protein